MPRPRRFWFAASLLFVIVNTGARIEMVRARGPYPLYRDERHVTENAWRMVKDGTAKPGFYRYGSLPLYFAGAVMGTTAAMLGQDATEVTSVGFPYYAPQEVAQAARIAFLLLSAVGLLASGVAASLAFRHDALLLLTPAALALSPSYLRQSWAYVNVDAFATALALVSMAYALATLDATDRLRRVVVPAALCAAITATKYNSALLCLPFLILLVRARGHGSLVGRLLGFSGLYLLAFVSFQPYSVFDGARFLADVRAEVLHYRGGHAGHEGEVGLVQLGFYLTELYRDFGPVLTTLGIAGIVTGVLRWRVETVVLSSFPLAMLLHLSLNRVHFVRTALPVFGIFAVFIGYGAITIVELARAGFARTFPSRHLPVVASVVGWGLVAALLAWDGVPGRAVASHAATTDSRSDLAAWLAERAPERCLLFVPVQLAFDTSTLPARCTSYVFDLRDMSLAQALAHPRASAPSRVARWVIWSEFGFDPREPSGKALASAWNAAPTTLGLGASLVTFRGRKVWVNYQTIELGNPALAVYRAPASP
jgi:hypothetical protein